MVSLVLAGLSMFLVHPDRKYISYIDWHSITLLFCLMAVMAGFKETGLFRTIVMTSLAFILGLLPLVFASGPGSASRQGIGTGVFFGMLVAISVGIVFVPFFFVWIYRIKAKLKKR